MNYCHNPCLLMQVLLFVLAVKVKISFQLSYIYIVVLLYCILLNYLQMKSVLQLAVCSTVPVLVFIAWHNSPSVNTILLIGIWSLTVSVLFSGDRSNIKILRILNWHTPASPDSGYGSHTPIVSNFPFKRMSHSTPISGVSPLHTYWFVIFPFPTSTTPFVPHRINENTADTKK